MTFATAGHAQIRVACAGDSITAGQGGSCGRVVAMRQQMPGSGCAVGNDTPIRNVPEDFVQWSFSAL